MHINLNLKIYKKKMLKNVRFSVTFGRSHSIFTASSCSGIVLGSDTVGTTSPISGTESDPEIINKILIYNIIHHSH